MENEASDSSSSSGESAPLIIMPPPPTSNDYYHDYDLEAGLNNLSRVSNLRDALILSSKITNNEGDIMDASLAHEVIHRTHAFKPLVSADEALQLIQSEQKSDFLKHAMSVNVHEEINNSVNILLDPYKEEEDYNYAFVILGEYKDCPNFSNDFQKLGGFQIFTLCLKSVHTSVRCKTAELIATVVKHNPYCQVKFIENPTYINLLINLVEKDKNLNVRIKALHAISCLVRQNVSVFWKLIELGVEKVIVNAISSTYSELKIKAAFLILAAIQMDDNIGELFVDVGVVEIICTIIMTMKKSMKNYQHDLFLTTLNQFLEVSPDRVKEICSKFKELKKKLLSLQRGYKDDSNFQEEKDQITWLMESLALNE